MLFKVGFVLVLGIVLMIVAIFLIFRFYTQDHIYREVNRVPEAYTALVLGAKVYNSGNPSAVLKDRLDSALELYKAGKIKRFLLSGDHGQKRYDEVNNMKKYLERNGVTQAAIFLDHAGFDTYDSVVRAKKIFQVKDVIIVTQAFHLPRSVFIARRNGLKAYGLVADKRPYITIRQMQIRELLANVKAMGNVLFQSQPRYLGKTIPITGDSRKSYD